MPIRSRKFRFASAISAFSTIVAAIGGASAQNTAVDAKFRQLGPGSPWKLEQEIPLEFDTFHPQGMTRVGDRTFLSSVEVVDRINEEGIGHLFEFDAQGNLVRDLELAEGPLYHPGGIDFDGESIWLSLAEYRPDSTSIVYRINPDSFETVPVFRFDDHLGAVAHLREQRLLIGVSWGSRRIYEWETESTDAGWQPVNPDQPRAITNPSRYIAYQDVQHIPGTPYVLASGVRKLRSPGRGTPPVQFGGIDLLEFPGATLRHGLPLNLVAPSGVPMTQNPFHVEMNEGDLHLRFIPEDNQSTIYIITPKN